MFLVFLTYFCLDDIFLFNARYTRYDKSYDKSYKYEISNVYHVVVLTKYENQKFLISVIFLLLVIFFKGNSTICSNVYHKIVLQLILRLVRKIVSCIPSIILKTVPRSRELSLSLKYASLWIRVSDLGLIRSWP